MNPEFLLWSHFNLSLDLLIDLIDVLTITSKFHNQKKMRKNAKLKARTNHLALIFIT